MRQSYVWLAASLVFIWGCAGSHGNKASWKAAFLTNGQVYYGKLTQSGGQFYQLQDVYYIRINQPQEDKTKPPEVSLVKLGSEFHGPEDALYLNRDHILYLEDLKTDGPVVKAIIDAKTAAANPTAPSNTPPSLPSIPPEQFEQFKQFQEFMKMKKEQATAPAKPEKN